MRHFAQSERGGTAVEYGLVVALIVIAMIAALQAAANQTIGMYNHVQTEVVNATNGVG
jgi:pilus assembly protein Flp/PilA